MSDSSAYKQPEAGFPSRGPLGQPSKPAAVIADRAPLGWPTHLAVCPPLFCQAAYHIWGFCLFLSAEAVSLLSRASWAYPQQTFLNADGKEYIWALWVSASSSLGLCQWLCMEAWGTLWCHSKAAWLRKGSRCDACTLLQMRCHLLWKAALWVSHSWDLGKGSIVCIHFQLDKMDRGIVQRGTRRA